MVSNFKIQNSEFFCATRNSKNFVLGHIGASSNCAATFDNIETADPISTGVLDLVGEQKQQVHEPQPHYSSDTNYILAFSHYFTQYHIRVLCAWERGLQDYMTSAACNISDGDKSPSCPDDDDEPLSPHTSDHARNGNEHRTSNTSRRLSNASRRVSWNEVVITKPGIGEDYVDNSPLHIQSNPISPNNIAYLNHWNLLEVMPENDHDAVLICVDTRHHEQFNHALGMVKALSERNVAGRPIIVCAVNAIDAVSVGDLPRRAIVAGAADFVFLGFRDAAQFCSLIHTAIFRWDACQFHAEARTPFIRGESNANDNGINHTRMRDASVLCKLDDPAAVNLRKQEEVDEMLEAQHSDLVAAHADTLWRFLPQKILTILPLVGKNIHEGDFILGPYRCHELIGKGSFGHVYKATRTNSQVSETAQNRLSGLSTVNNHLSIQCPTGKKICVGERIFETILQKDLLALKIMEKINVRWVELRKQS